jgi:hypothetical protein
MAARAVHPAAGVARLAAVGLAAARAAGMADPQADPVAQPAGMADRPADPVVQEVLQVQAAVGTAAHRKDRRRVAVPHAAAPAAAPADQATIKARRDPGLHEVAQLFTFQPGDAKASPPLLGAWHRAWLMLVPILGCAQTRAGADNIRREHTCRYMKPC